MQSITWDFSRQIKKLVLNVLRMRGTEDCWFWQLTVLTHSHGLGQLWLECTHGMCWPCCPKARVSLSVSPLGSSWKSPSQWGLTSLETELVCFSPQSPSWRPCGFSCAKGSNWDLMDNSAAPFWWQDLDIWGWRCFKTVGAVTSCSTRKALSVLAPVGAQSLAGGSIPLFLVTKLQMCSSYLSIS